MLFKLEANSIKKKLFYARNLQILCWCIISNKFVQKTNVNYGVIEEFKKKIYDISCSDHVFVELAFYQIQSNVPAVTENETKD